MNEFENEERYTQRQDDMQVGFFPINASQRETLLHRANSEMSVFENCQTNQVDGYSNTDQPLCREDMLAAFSLGSLLYIRNQKEGDQGEARSINRILGAERRKT